MLLYSLDGRRPLFQHGTFQGVRERVLSLEGFYYWNCLTHGLVKSLLTFKVWNSSHLRLFRQAQSIPVDVSWGSKCTSVISLRNSTGHISLKFINSKEKADEINKRWRFPLLYCSVLLSSHTEFKISQVAEWLRKWIEWIIMNTNGKPHGAVERAWAYVAYTSWVAWVRLLHSVSWYCHLSYKANRNFTCRIGSHRVDPHTCLVRA